MSNTKANNIVLWIFENQDINLDERLVSEATKTVQQTLSVLINASDRITFGIEPSAFLLAFHQLARIEDYDAR